jgi:release factor glutamine methyltransferase
MKVAGNKVGQMADFYRTILTDLYTVSEADELLFKMMEHYLGYSRQQYQNASNELLNQSDLLKLYDAGKRLSTGEPYQYITGEGWFYHYPFKVNKSVLIPRPETEELTELIIKETVAKGLTILDVGTGSGCIPITLKKQMPDVIVSACDISEDALMLAQENAKRLQTEVNFFKYDVLSENVLPAVYDVIVSNPPYILQKEALELHENVRNFEPHLALFVKDEDAIVFYRKIIALCLKHLKSGGMLYFELHNKTAEEVKSEAMKSGLFKQVHLLKDLSGNIRFLKAQKV